MKVECVCPGSVPDAKMFSHSEINKNLRNGLLPNSLQTLVAERPELPNYIIGDPTYPLTPYRIKEFDSCSSNGKVIYNNMLRSARNQIECTFGATKSKMGNFDQTVDMKLESISTVIYACFVSHYVCEENKVMVDEELLHKQIHLIKENETQFKNTPDPVYSCN